MRPVPNHPYASYEAGPDSRGQWWIHCACSFCGDRLKKPCNIPSRTDWWVYRYAVTHGHGLHPTHQGKQQ